MTAPRTMFLPLVLMGLLVATILLAVPATGASLGAGCDEDRTAVVHRADGQLLDPAEVDGPARVACGTDTGHYTGETTIAVTQEGTVWFSAADWEWALVRSDDEGATWERYAVPGPQAYPGCPGHTAGVSPLQCDNSQQAKNNTVADAFLYVDPVTDRMMWAKTYGYATCSSMNMTADNGETWQAVTSFACPGGDYEKIASGPAPEGTPQPTGEQTPHVYYTCTNGYAPTFVVGPARVCYKSLDAGLTWDNTGVPLTPTPMAPGCLHFQEPPKVAQEGADFAGRVYQPLGCTSLDPAAPNPIQLAYSDDQMTTWSYVPVPVGDVGANGGGLFGGVTAAVDASGTVYVLWTNADGDLTYAWSDDVEAGWSDPIVLNAPGVTRTGPAAQIAAAADGQIAVAHYGRPDGAGDGIQHGYLTESFDADTEDPTFWSTQLNDSDDPLYFPTDGGSLPRNDYLGVTIAPDGTPWTALVKLLTPEPDAEGFIQSTGFAARTVWAE